MSDPATPRLLLIRFIVASLTAFVIAAATSTARSQAPKPQAAPKSMLIQVEPAPALVAPSPAQPAPPAAPAPPPPENPGLINELGKLFKNSTSVLPTLPAMPPFTGLGENNEALTRLNTMVKGRMVCPVAANGAPDCKTASDRLCQSKGFKEGKSLDTDAAESCSPKVMLPGRKREADDCKTENYVVRALCQ